MPLSLRVPGAAALAPVARPGRWIAALGIGPGDPENSPGFLGAGSARAPVARPGRAPVFGPGE